MKIYNARLFGNKISTCEVPSLPDNVYYDRGRFNPLLTPANFDFNNVFKTPVGAKMTSPFEQGQYGQDHKNTGEIVAGYGAGGVDFVNTSEGLSHIYDAYRDSATGDWCYPTQYDWTNYYLPLVSIESSTTPYTKVCFEISLSSVGAYEHLSNTVYFWAGIIYHDPSYDERYPDFDFLHRCSPESDFDNDNPPLPTEDLVTSVFEVDIPLPWSEEYPYDYPYVYICAGSSGKYIFKKIWFE